MWAVYVRQDPILGHTGLSILYKSSSPLSSSSCYSLKPHHSKPFVSTPPFYCWVSVLATSPKLTRTSERGLSDNESNYGYSVLHLTAAVWYSTVIPTPTPTCDEASSWCNAITSRSRRKHSGNTQVLHSNLKSADSMCTNYVYYVN